MVTNHQITLSGLAAGTTYYYQVSSTDSKSNNGHSGGHGFKTAGFEFRARSIRQRREEAERPWR